MVEVICLGLSFKTAPVEVRERAGFTPDAAARLLEHAAAGALPGVGELVVLSTCNRVELYAAAGENSAAETLYGEFAAHSGLSPYDTCAMTYLLTGRVCVEHLLRVAAGLDSLVMGEPQILGQIADAFRRACAARSVGAVLSALFTTALRTGKRARSETPISRGPLSVASVAARHAHHVLGELTNLTALIVGAGAMARSAASAVTSQGIGRLVIVNRTAERAEALAAAFGGRARPLAALQDALTEADVVITAATSAEPLLRAGQIAGIGRPLLIFDIALPRNVEPSVGALPGVQLHNLDDLQAVAEVYRERRREVIPQVEAIVHDGLAAFASWQALRAATPAIRELRNTAENARRAEIERLLHKLPGLSAHERALIEAFSQRLVNKLLHDPTMRIKAGVR